jgi:hypothetical protein
LQSKNAGINYWHFVHGKKMLSDCQNEQIGDKKNVVEFTYANFVLHFLFA